MNRIVHVAVHDLVKYDNVFDVVSGAGNVPVTATAQRLIDSLYKLYNRRTSKSHGRFNDDVDNYPTQKHINEYRSGSTDFSSLTLQMMATLKKEAGNKAAATGGHVFFAHFQREDRDYLLVTIINDKLSAALTEQYNVEDIQHLDLEGFRFAGRVNLSAWSEGEDRYISFLKGKGNVADYFKEFLGCSAYVPERKDTMDLVATLRQYAESELTQEEKDDFLRRAKGICERHARARTELSFEALANELLPGDPEPLLTVLTDDDRSLNDMFVPNYAALAPLVKFQAKTKHWSIEFERELLNKDIIFDPDDNTLLIKNLPHDLAKELREEMPAK